MDNIKWITLNEFAYNNANLDCDLQKQKIPVFLNTVRPTNWEQESDFGPLFTKQ